MTSGLAVRRPSRRQAATGAEGLLVAIFTVASFALFARNALDADQHDRVYLGAAGAAKDSMQYLAWATDAGHHGLIANLYGLHNGSHVFLSPVWLITGLLHVDAGVSYPLLLAAWQVAALVLLLVVLRRYIRLVLGEDGWTRVLALTLALFLVSPFYLFVQNLHVTISGQWTQRLVSESYAVQWISGDFSIGLIVAGMIGYVIVLERLLAAPERPRLGGELARPAGLAAAAIGAATALLHPWQGSELAVLTLGVAIWNGPRTRRNLRLLLPLVSIAVPLAYYLILPRIDVGWKVATRPGGPPGISLVGWLTTFGPALLASIPGWLRRPSCDRERLLWLWPIAVAVTFLVSPTGKFHAFDGVSVPLALIAIQGWRRVLTERGGAGRGLQAIAAGGAAVLVCGAVPATRSLVSFGHDNKAIAQLARPEADALGYIARQPRGGVISTEPVGIWVPALTDDPTYVGHYVWSAKWGKRTHYARRLFDLAGVEPLSARAALKVIDQPDARYVLEPCRARADLAALLLPRGWTQHVFSCATVFVRG